MRIRIKNLISICSYGMFVMVFAIILLAQNLDYPVRQSFLLPNIVLLMIGILLMLFLYRINKKWNVNRTKNFFKKLFVYRWIIFVVMCLIQIYVSYHIYFYTGWDAGDEVLPASQALADGLPQHIDNWYFSLYTNNITLAIFYGGILKIGALFGAGNIYTDSGIMLLISIQCILLSLTGYLICACVYDLSHSYKLAFLSCAFFCALLGSSPWVVIPYSDSMGLVFPVAIFRLYQMQKNRKYIIGKWCGIVILTFWGYTIKPQVAIITIAIVMIEVLSCSKKKYLNRYTVAFLLSVMLCIGISQGVYTLLIRQSGMQIDTQLTMGMPHFLMMGLNSETGGIYSQEDVDFSRGFELKQERNNADIQVAIKRIKEYGTSGLLLHEIKKILCVYNDAGFAWGVEGGFYKYIVPEKNKVLSPLLRNLFWDTGKYYSVVLTIRQCVWITLLFLGIGMGLLSKWKKEEQVLLLSIFGITLFELLFEVRARYLYIYVPMIIILGGIGTQQIFTKFKVRCVKN